ncbi:MAG: DUF1800 family protein [Opitutaceae bacterium]
MKIHPLFRVALLLVATAGFAPGQTTSLSNLSTRAQVGTGGNIIITGFNVGPGSGKTVLIRATGPTLGAAPFSVPGVISDPQLELFSGSTHIARNDNWATALDGATPVTAATFLSVGAFALPATSRDAALVVTLPPGSYTAQVSGVGTATGVALIEVYEMPGGTSRLYNLSTRAQVGTGGNILIPGLVISPGAGTRRLLIRAAGPTLTGFGVAGALADPTILITNAAGTPPFSATNNDWGTPLDNPVWDATVLSTAFTQAGAFNLALGSKDSALVVEVPAGSYTIQTSGINNGTGVAIVEVYDLTPVSPPVVTLAATKSTADESGNNLGEFTFTRTGDLTFPLIVNYGVGGTAVNGADYPPLLGVITFPAGVSSVKLPLSPNPDVQSEGTDTVVLTLAAGPGYTVGTQASGTVSITDSPATLYVATLRPASSATGSIASGTATILLSNSGTLAAVNLSFSNLSSAQVTAHLLFGNTENYLTALPNGQVSGAQWTFAPTAGYTSTQLLDALRNGNITLRIDSARYPGGELGGLFILGSGSQTFTPPAASPAFSLANASATAAARFLTQATFGPKKSEIDALTGQNLDSWLTAQMALPFTSHRTATTSDRTTYGGSNSVTNWNAIHPPNRQSAWFKTVLTAPDQLRQRVAFALSQILVVSDISLGDDSRTEPLAAYYDILGNGAFGNFRTLLETVTLNPMMAEYLSSLRNAKATYNSAGAVLTTPDENYAREIMQLFTIGLNLLQPDGTLQLGGDGLPIPTYNQTTITELAKVFTGWAYASTNLTQFRNGPTNYYNPLGLFPSFHEDSAKNLSPVLATTIPANLGGVEDLKRALDALFNHQNTGPFLSRQLIQRLVTSNPSPAYIYRVAQKFANNGSGVRGDLGAVVRAILTDYEARSPDVITNVTFGKLKEPLIRLTSLFRTFNASSRLGRFSGYQYTIDGVPITSSTPNPNDQSRVIFNGGSTTTNLQSSLAEAALRSPTVFNFYSPDYVLPGELAKAGLVVPEFQITDDIYSINVPNTLRNFIIANNTATTVAGNATIVLDLAYEQTLVGNPAALIDHLATVLTANSMTPAARARAVTALNGLGSTSSTLERAQIALLLVATSPAGATQK